ncbi:alpha 1,6 mannopyranosyltransferase [Corynebacterium tapiri]|uniref:Alpha 1,6 mannopyranosyltransferase n=1 Tax=Corynebacterium tapiri TaxID=1448266 RepID=A0A5C4U3Q0_9CORY|nr:alpha 1,6 mannopyranosyltransferase [Corynebacterium tapiri]
MPHLGRSGSRAAHLHNRAETPATDLKLFAYHRFLVLRWIGTVGALLIGVGGLGAGALPVVNNPYGKAPLGDLMARMLQTSSSIVLIGAGLIVLAWLIMSRYVGAASVHVRDLAATFLCWSLPIALTAPLFTQDIYSYLAQGSIVAHGMDPYSAGPVQLLGAEHHLARSVPFIWAESPSPYGPVALGLSALVSVITNDSIVLGVLAHRALSLAGIASCAWAVLQLSRRCGVRPTTALWLGILNPLTLLHLVGGIHNEAVMLGLALVGLELGLRGVDKVTYHTRPLGFGLIALGGVLITCAGLVKVTGFIGLGFLGMALARKFSRMGRPAVVAIGVSASAMACVLALTVAAVTAITGIGLGWITGQGGAATIRSWMSITTDIGVISGFFAMLLGLGDHTEAILSITRLVGVLIAGGFVVRMLFAVYRGAIHPVGGLGVGTFVLVILFPVVHPWYLLWAIIPLATWANRAFFRVAVMAYSAAMSFFVLPRGLALPAATVGTIYVGAAIAGGLIMIAGWWLFRRKSIIT